MPELIILPIMAITLFLSYLAGCFNTAYFLGKKKKINVLESGSKNPGASNAMVTMGWKAGVLVGAADIFKCALSVFVARLVFPTIPEMWFVAVLGCILGHMFPFYMKFKGGKGLACLVGALLALHPLAFAAGGLLIIIITLATDYIVISTYTLSLLFPVFAFFYGEWQGASGLVCCIIAAVISLLIIAKHFINFKRLLAGTEIGLRGANSGKYRKDKKDDKEA
jgi:glycerol-3-phosphate acyltransferase PlsY